MGLLRKIGAALRGSQHDTLQAVVDSQAIRILEQEIRDCQASVARAKVEMTKIVAERNACDRELGQLDQQSERLEERALQALHQGDEAMAEHLAQQMADIELTSTEQRKHQQNMQSMESSLRENLLKADRQIKQTVRELRLARASDSADRGLSGSQRQSSRLGEQLEDVQSSLARIRERRQQADDMSAASRTVDQMLGAEPEPETDQRASQILARLKKSQTA